MKKIATLFKTEFKLSLRSPDMILFGMIMPIVIVLIVGLIFNKESSNSNMLEMTFGAFLSIGICAVGLMGLPLVLADYREKKILKRLMVTPANPALLLTVQFLVQGIVAIISAFLVFITARFILGYRMVGSFLALAVSFLLVLVAIFSIGLLIASRAKDSKRAGILCSIVYFPMLLLSGTTIPFPVFPKVIQDIAQVFPLRQGIILLNGVSQGNSMFDYPFQIVILLAIALICSTISLIGFRWDMDS